MSSVRLAAVGAAAVLAMSLTACGSGSEDDSTSGGKAANPRLAAEVSALTRPRGSYPVPTAPVRDVTSLAGKTVYYIPISQQAPQFSVTQKALTAAMKTVGIHVQVCDGKGTPTDLSACVNRATEAKAGTIISDAVPYVLAANAFDDAQAAGIPVIISNQITDRAHPASKTLTYIPTPGADQEVALAKWISLDSNGEADVLINQSTDGPSPGNYVAAGKRTFAGDCAGCKVRINKISSANFSLIPSSTSSVLLKNPSISYVESQYEQFLQPTQTGVAQTSRTDVKGVTGAAQLSGLKALKSGDFLYAAASQASAYQGWVDTDAALRLMLGAKVPTYTIPVRLFTRESIRSVPLTAQAENSGEWFGPTTFTDDFKKLWGAHD